jgi:hypothetical protein
MNESAFPWAVDDGQKIVGNKGMTLRDYFAAKAMQGLLKNALTEEFHLIDNDWMAGISMDAYSMADAMLKAREA